MNVYIVSEEAASRSGFYSRWYS